MISVKWIVTIWKNGFAFTLRNLPVNFFACSVYVFNADVYAEGIENNLWMVWKNGIAATETPVSLLNFIPVNIKTHHHNIPRL